MFFQITCIISPKGQKNTIEDIFYQKIIFSGKKEDLRQWVLNNEICEKKIDNRNLKFSQKKGADFRMGGNWNNDIKKKTLEQGNKKNEGVDFLPWGHFE